MKKEKSRTCRAPGRLLFPPRHVSLSGFFSGAPEIPRAAPLLLWYTAPGALSHAWHVSAVFNPKNQTSRSEDEAGFSPSFLFLFPPARLLDMTESRAVTVGRKTARASVRSSLTPRWKLQQASLKENEMIASLKVGKQRQTSSTVILTPSISNGLASSCHVGRHMPLSLSLYLSPYSSQPQCTLIEKVAAHKHNTIEMQWLTLTFVYIKSTGWVNVFCLSLKTRAR